MTNRITTREWEAISAYLDGQLSAKDRTRLEARIQSSTELRSAVEEMRRTRIILRSQPKLRAPRNFTLTPQMVNLRPAPSRSAALRATPSLHLFPALRFAAALASVLLVMVLIGDFFTGAPPVTTAMNPVLQQQAEVAAEQNAPPGTGGGVEATQAANQLMIESAPPGQAEAGEAPLPNDTPIAAAKAFSETAPMAAAPAGAAGIESRSAMTPTIEAPAIAAAAPATTFTEEAAAMMAEAPAGGQPDQAQPSVEQPAAGTLAQEQVQRPLIGRSTLRVIEIILAAFAVGTGLLAFLLRRRANG